MLRDAAVDIIAKRLGQRTDLTSDIIAEMQLIQATTLERNGKFFPWFLLSEWSSASTVASEERVALPTDFLCESEEYPFQILDSNGAWQNLTKRAYDYAFEMYPASEALPVLYAVGDDYFYLRPIPDAVYTIRMRYFKRGLSLATNIENVWLKWAPDLVIALVGEVMARQYTQNNALADTFAAKAGTAGEMLYSQHMAREEANRERNMVA